MGVLPHRPPSPPIRALTVKRRTRLPPRVVSALVFGAAGMLPPTLWFVPALVTRHGDAVSWLLYLALPGACAAIAGALLGRPLAAPTAPGRGGGAMLRGVGVATAALLLFAPLYACVVKWTEPGWTSVLGLATAVLGVAALTLWWTLAVVGGLAGWLLYRWSLRRDPGRRIATG